MKDIKEIDIKELKLVVKKFNALNLVKTKIRTVGSSNEQILKDFSEAIEKLPEDADIPKEIASFYNDIYADEIDDTEEEEENDPDGNEIESDEEEIDPEEDEKDDPEEEEIDPEEDEKDDPEEEIIQEIKVEEIVPVKEKKVVPVKAIKDKKVPIIKDKIEKIVIDKRAVINPKMSLTDKVKNILNFAGQGYKQTTYFELDCETIKILERNTGLYPSEIQSIMMDDRKVADKIEKFNATIRVREINKIKSAYSYIVGAVGENKSESKLRHIMLSLIAGKQVPVEVAHPSTVKVARRALLAYMHCQKIEYKAWLETRKELTVAASKQKMSDPVAPKEITPKVKAPKEITPKVKAPKEITPKVKASK